MLQFFSFLVLLDIMLMMKGKGFAPPQRPAACSWPFCPIPNWTPPDLLLSGGGGQEDIHLKLETRTVALENFHFQQDKDTFT